MKDKKIVIPEGAFYYNCTDDCKYWEPHKKDQHGRTWCNAFDTHYYPSDRNGCGRYKKY